MCALLGEKDYWGNFMKARYFFRAIWRMFDFKGMTSRAEYFTYAVTSFVVTVFLTLAAVNTGMEYDSVKGFVTG
ncbi:hypothetical protein ASG86_12545 [Arthrobacter sp. Soil764]|nr:hypothetical protein ASG86_12545 [Arthrobacter sp. Soil764]